MLTPEEKQRIEAEEKYRAEIRERQSTDAGIKNTKAIVKGCGCLALGILMTGATCGYFLSKPHKGERDISRQQYGDLWPLTVETGRLACRGNAVTFTDDRGTIYFLNGVAKMRNLGIDIDPIWQDTEPYTFTDRETGKVTTFTNKKPMILISDGLNICKEDGT